MLEKLQILFGRKISSLLDLLHPIVVFPRLFPSHRTNPYVCVNFIQYDGRMKFGVVDKSDRVLAKMFQVTGKEFIFHIRNKKNYFFLRKFIVNSPAFARIPGRVCAQGRSTRHSGLREELL